MDPKYMYIFTSQVADAYVQLYFLFVTGFAKRDHIPH